MATEEQVTEALTLLSALKKALQEDAANYALKMKHGAESNDNRELREYFRYLAEQVLQVELALGPLRPLPSAERFENYEEQHKYWASTIDEPANPDSVVRERS